MLRWMGLATWVWLMDLDFGCIGIGIWNWKCFVENGQFFCWLNYVRTQIRRHGNKKFLTKGRKPL